MGGKIIKKIVIQIQIPAVDIFSMLQVKVTYY